jgi:hypothetical protein
MLFTSRFTVHTMVTCVCVTTLVTWLDDAHAKKRRATQGAMTIPLTATHWTTAYDGYGDVTYDERDGIALAPKAAASPDTTHAALSLLNNHNVRNFRISVTANTVEQLRQNSAPNAWEVFWLFFNYQPTATGKDTNYFLLKPTGVELGTAHHELAQTFLYTGPASAYPIGVSNRFEIEKIGNRVTANINGQRVMDYTGNILDVSGQIGLYTEDARVQITDVQITPLP